MRLSRTSIQKAAAGVALGTGLVSSGMVSAGVVYDLRFASGAAHTQVAASGGNYTLELWARVSGTNGTTTDDGIQTSYIKILSSQTGTGALATGGLTTGAVTTDFQSFSGPTPLHRNGAPQELNADGIIDWGSNSTSSADTNYMFARNGGIVFGGDGVGQAITGGWEFKIAVFNVNAASLGTGMTRFDVVKPNATGITPVTYAVAKMDGDTFNVNSTNQQGAYTGSTGVLFIVPEPASLGLLGVAAIGLVGRRRRPN